ncbi:LacI family transcriptional regulator, partial [bacterium]
MAVTGKDIAKELGISQPTVSRILSGRGGDRISLETRERVLEAAARLEYQPNAIARSLRHGKTDVVGFYSVYDYDARNDFLGALIGSLQLACYAHHLDLLLFSAFSERSRDEIASKLRDGRIDGLFLHAAPSDPLAATLARASLHVVALADQLPGIPSASFDSEGGMRDLVAHLINKGYEKFVFVAPDVELESVERRREVFEAATRGREARVMRVFYEQSQPVLDDLGDWRGQKLAVCCWNDRAAYNLLEASQERGWQVPQDLAITGFDGFVSSHFPSRQLATVGGDWDELARAAHGRKLATREMARYEAIKPRDG